MGFSRQEYWSGLPFSSPVACVLSELSTMTCPSWVALQGMAHSFIELDKAVVHVITWHKTIYRYKTIHIAFSPRLCFKSVFFFFKECVHFIHIFTLMDMELFSILLLSFWCLWCHGDVSAVFHDISNLYYPVSSWSFWLNVHQLYSHAQRTHFGFFNFLDHFPILLCFEFSILSFSNFLQVKHR